MRAPPSDGFLPRRYVEDVVGIVIVGILVVASSPGWPTPTA